MRLYPVEGSLEGHRFSCVAGTDRPSRERERGREGAERAEAKTSPTTLSVGSVNGTISPDGEVSMRKARSKLKEELLLKMGRVRAGEIGDRRSDGDERGRVPRRERRAKDKGLRRKIAHWLQKGGVPIKRAERGLALAPLSAQKGRERGKRVRGRKTLDTLVKPVREAGHRGLKGRKAGFKKMKVSWRGRKGTRDSTAGSVVNSMQRFQRRRRRERKPTLAGVEKTGADEGGIQKLKTLRRGAPSFSGDRFQGGEAGGHFSS